MRIRVTSDPRTAVGWWAFGLEVPERKKSSSSMGIYHLVMTHIAMENHHAIKFGKPSISISAIENC